jgi:tripartite-type tricarboxylate transporter receptor subunit TctC
VKPTSGASGTVRLSDTSASAPGSTWTFIAALLKALLATSARMVGALVHDSHGAD